MSGAITETSQPVLLWDVTQSEQKSCEDAGEKKNMAQQRVRVLKWGAACKKQGALET